MEDLSGRIGQAFDRGVLAYHDDPAGFVQNCFRWPINRKTGKTGNPTDYQLDVMMALVEHGKVAVRGPRGLGKTTEAAWVILWFALTRDAAREDWKVVVTAGAWGQLINFLWPEVERKWTPRLNWEKIGRQQFGPLEMMRRELRLSFGAVTMGAPTDSAKIEGAHADELLYVFDEAKIIPEETWQSAEGAFSGAGEETEANAYALASSTPGAPQGHFYDIHAGAPGLESWHPVHVTIEQVVAAKRIGNQWIKDQEEYFGRESSFFQNHVLGEFALQQEDAVIRQDHLEEAHDRWRALGLPNPSRTDLQVPIHDSLPPLDTIGADIASTGSDRTVFALRHANIISALLWRPHQPDTMVTTGELKMLAETPERPARIVIDALNMGGPVADRLREQGRNVVDFVASKRSDLRTRGRQLGFVDCLTGDARVRPIGSPLRLYRGWHEGPVLRIQMASGDEFTVTPNHQVLTPQGWIAAKALHAGDVLCDPRVREGVAPVDPQVAHMPPTLSEVYSAARKASDSEWVEGTLVNFHGDRLVGEIEVVPIHGELFTPQPILREPFTNSALKGSLHGQRLHASLGGTTQTFGVLGNKVRCEDGQRPSLRPSRGANAMVLRSEPTRHESVSLGTAADPDPPFSQGSHHDPLVDAVLLSKGFPRLSCGIASCDCIRGEIPPSQQSRSLGFAPWVQAVFAQDTFGHTPVHSEVVGQRTQGLASAIPLNQIVNVNEVDAGGQWVYTIETSTGAYSTNSVVQKNCRAAMWWNVREMLEPESGCDLALPPDDQLTADLLAPRWEPGSDGRIRVESKKDIKKRLKRSTDAGDSVAQSLFLTRIAPTVAAPLILRRKGGSRLAPLRQRAGRIS